MSDTPSTTSGGLGVLGLLGVVFVVLKLIGEHFHTPVADWPWWLVTLPFWVGFAIVAVVLIIAGTGALIAVIAEDFAAKRRARKYRERMQSYRERRS